MEHDVDVERPGGTREAPFASFGGFDLMNDREEVSRVEGARTIEDDVIEIGLIRIPYGLRAVDRRDGSYVDVGPEPLHSTSQVTESVAHIRPEREDNPLIGG